MSFSGRTSASGADYRGSNPRAPSKFFVVAEGKGLAAELWPLCRRVRLPPAAPNVGFMPRGCRRGPQRGESPCATRFSCRYLLVVGNLALYQGTGVRLPISAPRFIEPASSKRSRKTAFQAENRSSILRAGTNAPSSGMRILRYERGPISSSLIWSTTLGSGSPDASDAR